MRKMINSARFSIGLLLLSLAGYLLFLPAELGMSLAIPPDSSEYAISLTNLLTHGKFGFTLNGTWYPSRYAPWFSLSCLTPGFWLFGGDSCQYQWMILVFALGMLVLVTKWARLAGLDSWWAYVPAVMLMLLPDFAFYSRLVMTEIPYSCLFATTGLLFVRLACSRSLSFWQCLIAGLLITWCGMVRSTALPMLLPFAVLIVVRHRRNIGTFTRLLTLGTPSTIFLIANALYNWKMFGSPTRSGYNFWVPVPCDFPNILFNLTNLQNNLLLLPTEPVSILTGLCLILALAYVVAILRGCWGGLRANRSFVLLLAYLLFQFFILLALYLSYYWYDTRFYLAVSLCSVPLGVAALTKFVQVGLPKCWPIALPLLLIGVSLSLLQMPTRYTFMTRGRPVWLEEARMTTRTLPNDSIVMQEGDPALMDHFGFAQKNIKLLPYMRRFDYVTYMTAPTSIRNEKPAPRSWQDKRIPELIARGVCGTPFPVTFTERPQTVLDYLTKGRRVFFHIGRSTNPEWMEPITIILSEMGLMLKPYAKMTSAGVEANPIRHLYDDLIFPGIEMDVRHDTEGAWLEIVRKEEKE